MYTEPAGFCYNILPASTFSQLKLIILYSFKPLKSTSENLTAKVNEQTPVTQEQENTVGVHNLTSDILYYSRNEKPLEDGATSLPVV